VRVSVDPVKLGPEDIRAKLAQLGYKVAPKA